MRKFLSFVCLIAVSGCFQQGEDLIKSDQDQFKKVNLDEKMYPYDGHYLARQYPSVNPHLESRDLALRSIQRSLSTIKRTNENWETQGPGNLGARINSIAVSRLMKILYL